MTLIQVVLTPNYVVLVGDRRKTTRIGDPTAPGGFQIVSQEDMDTKNILPAGRYVLGFAGRARVGLQNERMESWIVNQLKPVREENYLEVLEARSSDLFATEGYRDAHAFIAAGFNSYGRPEVVTISNNLHDGEVRFSAPFFPADFETHVEELDDHAGMYRFLGSIPVDTLRRVKRALRTQWNNRPQRPDRVIRPMLTALAETSAASSGTVGDVALITSFPKIAVPVPLNANIFVNYIPRNFRESHVSMTTYSGKPFAIASDDTLPDQEKVGYYPAMVTKDGASVGTQYSFGTGADPPTFRKIEGYDSDDPPRFEVYRREPR